MHVLIGLLLSASVIAALPARARAAESARCSESRSMLASFAATALEHGLTLVSRDTSEYEKTRVPLLNPWI